MHCCIISESVVPHVAALAKRVDDEAARQIEAHKTAVLQFVLRHEIDLMRMEDAHRRIVNHFLKDVTIDSLDTFSGFEPEEKNVWAAFQQVGPIPSVSQANVKEDENCAKVGIPFKALFWPCQGSKIWDWMRGARPEDVIPKLKKPLPPAKTSSEIKPLPIKEPLSTPPSESSSEVSTPRSISPIGSSNSATSSDSEETSAPSSASSDSGFGSEKSGSTTKKLKKYKVKVFTAEEIEKRDLLVDEWKKKIQASLLA